MKKRSPYFKISHIEVDSPFILAPMAGYTDTAFRQISKRFGAGLVFTEMVNARGLVEDKGKIRRLLIYEEIERPIGAQIFGNNIKYLTEAGKVVEDLGFDFVDVNMGCPVRKIVRSNAGSALLKNIKHVEAILDSIVRALSIPVTIKIRSGWNREGINYVDIADRAEKCGIAAITFHPRTRMEMFKGRAKWEQISELSHKVRIPCIGNGDIANYKEANERLSKYNCKGVMIGRGSIGNPWIFRDALSYLYDTHYSPKLSLEDRFELIREHLALLQNYCDDKIATNRFKNIAASYLSSFPYASKVRKHIYCAQNSAELYEILEEYKGYLQENYKEKLTYKEQLLQGVSKRDEESERSITS